MKKSGGTITHPAYVTARWPPRQIPPLNFLGCSVIVRIISYSVHVHLQERVCEESASFELSSYDISSCIQETDRLLTKTVEVEELNKDFRDDNAAGRFL